MFIKNQKIREAHLDGRNGVISSVHATTYTVYWEDGTYSRVKHSSVAAVGRTLRDNAPTIPRRQFKRLTRRFEAVVKDRMRELGLTLEDLEDRSGVPRRTLTRLAERDDPDSRGFHAEIIERLARALELAPGDFWELR